MTTEHADTHVTGDHHEDHGGYGKYYVIAVLLIIATAASYWTFTDLWPFGESIVIKRLWMMAVSCFKASLVIMVFMHLWWEANWKWVLTVPASCMCVFLTLALVPDVGMRIYNGFSWYSRERLTHAAVLPADESVPSDGQAAGLEHDPGHEQDGNH